MSDKRKFDKKYKKKATEYHLVFQSDNPDDDLNDLEVYIRSLPIEQFVELADLSDAASADSGKAGQVGVKVLNIFASALVDWNLTDEFEEDVPATRDGVFSQELDFILRIVQAWMQRMGGVDNPLQASSSGGRQSREVSLPMEVSLQSPQS